MPITSTAACHGPVPWTSRGRSGAGWGDHPDAAPARLVRPDHDRQARRSYSPAGARPQLSLTDACALRIFWHRLCAAITSAAGPDPSTLALLSSGPWSIFASRRRLFARD
jgi:hypothetical protein